MTFQARLARMDDAVNAERMVQKAHNIRADRRRRITKAFYAGDKKARRKEVHAFFKDKRVKMSALHKAGERHPNSMGWEVAAKSLAPFTPFPEPVNWWSMPKAKGGYRIACDLPRPLKAIHYMIADALYAQMDILPFIFDLRGRGRNMAILRLLEKLQAGYNSYRVFDVKDCFQNVNPEVVYNLPLPRRIIDHALNIQNLSLQRVAKQTATVTGDIPSDTLLIDDAIESGPAGLMQGSPASNVILAWLLRNLPQPDNDDWVLSVYADDLIVVAKQDDTLERVEQMLLGFFERPELGPLFLKKKAAGTGLAFDYLGCEFRHSSVSGEWELDLSHKNWDKLHRKRYAEMAEYKRKYPHGIFVDEEKSIRGVVASFPLAEGRAAIREIALSFGPEWPERERAKTGLMWGDIC